MTRTRLLFAAVVFAVGAVFLSFAYSQPQPAKKPPRLEPVAETKLLMEGLADPNTRALGKLLAAKPKDAEAWNFARGQALLLAEAGNLLLMRPPRTKAGEEAWQTHAAELRDSAAGLARAAAAKDYLQARTALAGVGNACNRCHQTFRVAVRVDPFPDQ
ncbi:MAG: cytochrome c [Planctomycetes bacterium]|nr:cytochrome c [Planctomycetota bacterium]